MDNSSRIVLARQLRAVIKFRAASLDPQTGKHAMSWEEAMEAAGVPDDEHEWTLCLLSCWGVDLDSWISSVIGVSP